MFYHQSLYILAESLFIICSPYCGIDLICLESRQFHKQSINIENIQIYFTKILFYRCKLTKRSYEDRINVLNIKTLFHRRLLADHTLTKILNGLVDVDATDIFDLYSNNFKGTKLKIRKKKCRKNANLNYFGKRVCSSGYLFITITSCKTVTLFREKIIHTK